MNWLLVLILFLPVVISLLFTLEKLPRIHFLLDLSGSIIRILLVGFVWWIFSTEHSGSTLLFQLDTFALQFLLYFSVLWLIIGIYAQGYAENFIQHSRFLAFSGFSAAAVTGIIISANLLILLIFYELLALSVYALLSSENTPETK